MKNTSSEEPKAEQLVNHIVNGIQEKKGHEIVTLDLRELENAVCDFFVICHGASDTQVEALAESVEETVRKQRNEKPSHIEGKDNAEWILLDYFDVVVHIFLENKRYFFQLEEVWADAKRTVIEE
jgi:ribosome-associated protein